MLSQNILDEIANKWNLTELNPITSRLNNHVFSGFRNSEPIILKLSSDIDALNREIKALEAFKNHGAVSILAKQEGAVLLKKASGTSLKTYFPKKDKEAIHITSNIIKKLHSASIPKEHNFPHIKNWLSALDNTWDIPNTYLEKARALRDNLLKTATNTALLHGDLHHDNILQNGSDWIVIDPKGVIGDPAYEVAAFIRNPMPELLELSNADIIVSSRIEEFAKLLNLDPQRIKAWCFVQAVLCWIWALEDGTDSDYFERLTGFMDQIE